MRGLAWESSRRPGAHNVVLFLDNDRCVEPGERPPMKEAVMITYHRADATHHLMVAQRPVTEREPDWAPHARAGIQVEEVERDGHSFTVYRPDRRRHGIPLTVIFERDATAIQLSSANLDEEVLLGLSASMVRVEVP